jgi:hypothetical protein
MAEWNSSTQYLPGTSVTYLGNTYLRSQYPPTATGGTNPHEEMSVDTDDYAIRTWELIAPSISTAGGNYIGVFFHTGYFSLKAADRSDGVYTKMPPMTNYPGKLQPENPYAGVCEYKTSAYGYTNFPTPINEALGLSVEMDQERAATSTLPNAPVMPAEKCGVNMQQVFIDTILPGEEPSLDATNGYAASGLVIAQNLIFDSETEKWVEDVGAEPRIFYVFLLFNHPLYFRRQHTIKFRYSKYDYTEGYSVPNTDPPVYIPPTHEGTYISETQTVMPTDDNLRISPLGPDGEYINPSNAVATFTIPDDTYVFVPDGPSYGTTYNMVEIYISDVASN